MDKKQFEIKLKQCVISVFNDIENKDDLFEFGIFTDQDTSSITICYNTYSHFLDSFKKNFLEKGEIITRFRWSIPEWCREIGGENFMIDSINDILYDVIQPQESELYPDSFKDNILDLLCSVLINIKEEGLFSDMKENFILYVEQADSWIDDLMKQRIRKLVGERYYEEFLYDMKNEL